MIMKKDSKPAVFIAANIEAYSHIKGWGVDADLENDPTYPMKKRTDEEQFGYTWERPEMQPQQVEILTSTERKNMPAVFGTAVPPSGISGMIRRIAYTYSESDYARWLPLMLADRVAVVEGIIDDITGGHLPNIFAEKGMKADLKYNRKELIIKVGAVAAVTAAAIFLLRKKRGR